MTTTVAALELELELAKDTKGTIVYAQAERADGLPQEVRTLYVAKWAAKQLGDPRRVRVTIEAVS